MTGERTVLSSQMVAEIQFYRGAEVQTVETQVP
jgi:hypothetical protein